MVEDKRNLDVLGVKPIAESVNTVTEAAVRGASAFLSRICLPVAEEFGLLLKDKVGAWRASNAVAIAAKAQILLEKQARHSALHAHPRIVNSVIENGSWTESDFVQQIWAGLLASSCTEKGNDESNLMFVDLLSQLTSAQVRLINHVCATCKVYQTKGGWIASLPFFMELGELVQIMGIDDIHQIDRELDHLRSLELITHGFSPEHTRADVTPYPLCLNLYVRGQGYVGSPGDFFGAPAMSEEQVSEREEEAQTLRYP